MKVLCLIVPQDISFFRNRYVVRITPDSTVPTPTQCKKLQCLPSEKFSIGINNGVWGHHCNLCAFMEGRPVLQELDQYLFLHSKANSSTSLSLKHWQLSPTTDTLKFMHEVFRISMHH